jgi:segregation and condensation protein B
MDLQQSDVQQSDIEQIKRALEAALLSSPEPIPVADLRKLFDADYGAEVIRRVLEELKSDWLERGAELVNVASGWRFQVRPEFQNQLDRLNPQRPPRYSRAVLETLAIISYKQPVTRGDIEDVRGVSVSSNILRVLEARGWIDIVGHRESPGRPALFSTTRAFLDDLNLRSLDELPPLEELGALVEGEGDELEEGVHGIAEGKLEGVASEMAEAEKAEVMTTVTSDAAALPVEREGDDANPIEAQSLT